MERSLPEGGRGGPVPGPPPGADEGQSILSAAELEARERDNILRALEASSWKIAGDGGAAGLLGLPSSTLTSRVTALGIRRPLTGR